MQAFRRLRAKDIQKQQLTEIAAQKLVKLTKTFSDSSTRTPSLYSSALFAFFAVKIV